MRSQAENGQQTARRGEADLKRLLEAAAEDPEVLAVIQFGSTVLGEATASSDIDVCLVLHLEEADRLALSRKLFDYAGLNLDLHVFGLLPLYIRRRVLKEGRVLFCRDEDQLYELAFRTAQAFEDYRHIYREYLEEVARAGP
ncbi:type VII toxin-antitoxin system MntA family adenylyltransferase antitoxin [Candidatus Methanocrinis natronophilus]|uniref:Nucleotidyltransferase domain-containing protein n=1 Tax=Candidatus Methanocrinis natronophilus TaxID=3033396 RepID=A0ABT5XAZ6_9EURY|nr:nucleotidyltransferase domain-containing protein [Candidatus Methanocrinis natronophilus]MDF0591831.1 nucleotidyltransferase domain-containing protein [Candidatus Methanocrinis natronophilus]